MDRQEPTTYNHLPHYSVARGVTSALQEACNTDENLTTVNLYLTTLLQPTPKPLPSLSWAFLAPLATQEGEEGVALNVVRLCAKQSQISPSARNITQAFIASSNNDVSVDVIFSCLFGSSCSSTYFVSCSLVHSSHHNFLKERLWVCSLK